MIKILWGVLVIALMALAGVTGFVIGERRATRRQPVAVTTTSTGVSFPGLANQPGVFCAVSPCTTVAVRGQVKSYDPGTRQMVFQLNQVEFSIGLNQATVVDNEFGLAYFEQTFKPNDTVTAVFQESKPEVATEVYFEKTGSIAKKRQQ